MKRYIGSFLLFCFGAFIGTAEVRCEVRPQKLDPNTCNLAAEKEAFFRDVGSFRQANDALKKLSEELNSNKDPRFAAKFSYAYEHQTEALSNAKKLVGDGNVAFNKLVDSIVRRRTRACEVCQPEVKSSYENAKRADIIDIKVDALLNEDVQKKIKDVSELKGWVDYLDNHPNKRFPLFFGKSDADKTRDSLAKAREELNTLLNKITGSPEKMADAEKIYKCVD
jgi:hypothetical protein